MHYDDLVTLGSKNAAKEAGKLRIEGKEYVVKDGDVIEFRFNVSKWRTPVSPNPFKDSILQDQRPSSW